jgi:FkbM family methyltransferase
MKGETSMIRDVCEDWPPEKTEKAQALCQAFLAAPKRRRFLFGRNVYAEAVAKKLEVGGVVDDFTKDTHWAGLCVTKLADLPADSIVLACSGGRPLTVRRLLDEKNITHLDYFSFMKHSGLDLPEAVFNEGCAHTVSSHREDLEWLEGLMADEISLDTLRMLMTFRMSYDLDALEGFSQREDLQYFEPFINYSVSAAVFVDVGGYDGNTAIAFINRVPDYKAVHIFEPEAKNQTTCQTALAEFDNISLHPCGAGAKDAILRFSSCGSASAIAEDGELEIQIRRIDDLVTDVPTFLKMDIEGAELEALDGARAVISEHHPALAICVYHRPSDFWEVPRKVLSMYDGYSVYLRHYTESIYETVMYFVPDSMHVR